MALYIIGFKKYDTDKMEFIANISKYYPNPLFSKIINDRYDGKLYRSKKGTYLFECNKGGEVITEQEAKDLLLKYDYKAYEKLFGELEEG